jgi:hypothetical protein
LARILDAARIAWVRDRNRARRCDDADIPRVAPSFALVLELALHARPHHGCLAAASARALSQAELFGDEAWMRRRPNVGIVMVVGRLEVSRYSRRLSQAFFESV